MSAESAHRSVRIGDVSGTAIVGDNNTVTKTEQHPEQPPSRQENHAEDCSAVFALDHGTMHVTYNTAQPEREAED